MSMSGSGLRAAPFGKTRRTSLSKRPILQTPSACCCLNSVKSCHTSFCLNGCSRLSHDPPPPGLDLPRSSEGLLAAMLAPSDAGGGDTIGGVRPNRVAAEADAARCIGFPAGVGRARADKDACMEVAAAGDAEACRVAREAERALSDLASS